MGIASMFEAHKNPATAVPTLTRPIALAPMLFSSHKLFGGANQCPIALIKGLKIPAHASQRPFDCRWYINVVHGSLFAQGD